MAVPFHRLDQERQQRFQSLAANPVRDLPKNYQRISFGFLVNPATGAPNRGLPDIAPEQAHRMLSMEAYHNDKLVENSRLLRADRLSLALPHSGRQFSSSRHAQLAHYRPGSPIPLGSKLREATAQHSGTFHAAQCRFPSQIVALYRATPLCIRRQQLGASRSALHPRTVVEPGKAVASTLLPAREYLACIVAL